MPTAVELGIKPGDPFIHVNKAGMRTYGTVREIKEGDGKQEGCVEVWIEGCNLAGADPISELFPDGKHKFPLNDDGFKKFPKLGE